MPRAAPRSSPGTYCSRCRVNKPTADFRTRPNGAPYATCKDCCNARRREPLQEVSGNGRGLRNRVVAAQTEQSSGPSRPTRRRRGTATAEPNPQPPRRRRTAAPVSEAPPGFLPADGICTAEYADLGPMNVVCDFCGALHWMAERLSVTPCLFCSVERVCC